MAGSSYYYNNININYYGNTIILLIVLRYLSSKDPKI